MEHDNGPSYDSQPAFTADRLGELARFLPVGKRVGSEVYIHRDALARHNPTLLRLVSDYAGDGDNRFDWNVCKLSPRRCRFSLLLYPCFRKQAHPVLVAALTISLAREARRVRRYSDRGNRPVLHRKELLVGADDPEYQRFAELTEQEVRAGLFEIPSIIGHEGGWKAQLERCGLSIHDHELCHGPDGVKQR